MRIPKTGKFCGTDIDVVEIDGEFYALHDWNGEKYFRCWKCKDIFTSADDSYEYVITPKYNWNAWNDEAGEFQDSEGNSIDGVIGYDIVRGEERYSESDLVTGEEYE